MITFARPYRLLSMLAALLAGCRSAAAPVPVAMPEPITTAAPTASAQWMRMQSSVLTMLSESRTGAADSLLSQFTRDFTNTPEGDRARWWRTLMRADPRSVGAEPAAAIVQIDSLLADSVATEIRVEAMLIRRTISAIDSLRRFELRRRVQATQLAGDRLDEFKVARDSVVKLTAELDRLRRRLRAP